MGTDSACTLSHAGQANAVPVLEIRLSVTRSGGGAGGVGGAGVGGAGRAWGSGRAGSTSSRAPQGGLVLGELSGVSGEGGVGVSERLGRRGDGRRVGLHQGAVGFGGLDRCLQVDGDRRARVGEGKGGKDAFAVAAERAETKWQAARRERPAGTMRAKRGR